MIDRMSMIDDSRDKINELIDKVNYLEAQLSSKENIKSKVYDMIIELEEEIQEPDLTLDKFNIINSKIEVLRKVMEL